MEPEKLDLKKFRSMMNFAIEAIGKGRFDPDSWVHDRDDLGREFRLGRGLELGAENFTDDEFVGPQREYVLKAYKALGVQPPSSWAKSVICSDLLVHLRKGASGK